jgi:hypothetical protein
MLYIASKEEYLKINEVTKTPALEFFTFMNFYIRKCELDAIRIKRGSKNT